MLQSTMPSSHSAYRNFPADQTPTSSALYSGLPSKSTLISMSSRYENICTYPFPPTVSSNHSTYTNLSQFNPPAHRVLQQIGAQNRMLNSTLHHAISSGNHNCADESDVTLHGSTTIHASLVLQFKFQDAHQWMTDSRFRTGSNENNDGCKGRQ